MKDLITISLDVHLQSPQKRKAALLGKKEKHWLVDIPHIKEMVINVKNSYSA